MRVDVDQSPGALDLENDPLLRAAFEDAPFACWARDTEDRCIHQNAQARKTWGDLRGRRTSESPVPPEVAAAWEANNRRAHAGERAETELEHVAGGETRSYRCIALPLRAGGQARGILGFDIDITDRKRAEAAMRASEQRLRETLRVGRMGYLDWNLVTNEIRWSPETFRLFGYDPESGFVPTIEVTVGMVPPEDRPFVDERLSAVIAGTAPYDIDHRVIRPDGRVIYIHAQGEVTRDEHGRALRMLGTVVDVTERKMAQEALRVSDQRLKQALSAASAGIWERDLVKNTLVWSRENMVLYGLDPASAPPTSTADWEALLHPDDVERVNAAIADVLEGRTVEYRTEFRARRPGGGYRWIMAIGQVQRGPDGTPLRILGISVDITARKHAEDELREVDRRRSEFLSVLSHELRNPLTPIKNSLYLLDRIPPGGDEARRALGVIHRQVGHLARLVDDLLDVTRISSGKVRLQRSRVDLVELVRRTVDDHRTLLAGHEVTLSVPHEALWMSGDATRLAQVLGNLLSNAAKFTPENGKIEISLEGAAGRAVLEVCDDGIGIDAEMLRQVFEPFAQADRTLARSPGGLGLGLALVKALVELHGGEVTARSAGAHLGACFTVRLPLNEAATALAGPTAPDASKVGLRILVVEDNVDAADTLAAALECSGHQVTLAADGTTALALARAIKPEVILCDIGLPGALDGYEVARALKRDPTLAGAYRIAVTGYAQPEDQAKALEAGFDAHVAKPPDLFALEQLLSTAPPRS